MPPLLLDALPADGEVTVFDLEYTAWDGSLARDWSEDWEHREIIQIGAVRLSAEDGLAEIARFDALVRPTINPNLSDYVIELTGITEAGLAATGMSFREALDRFAGFVGDRSVLLCNGRDAAVLRENCDLNGVAFPFEETRCRNIRPQLAAALGIPESAARSGELPAKLGLPPAGEIHDAVADAVAIATVLRELRQRG
jgi:inhibitor of KinA sporulation pathway (predicted exonuclease)